MLGSEGCCGNSKLNSLEDEERAAVQEAGPHLREIRVSAARQGVVKMKSPALQSLYNLAGLV